MRLKEHYLATLSLGFPLILAQAGQIALGFVDSAMIGWHSVDELSAASFCINLFNLPIVLALGYSYGLTPLIGQSFGRGALATAGAWLRRGLKANLALGFILMLLMGIPLLFIQRLGLSPRLIPLIVPYYFTQLFSLPFISLFNAFKQFSDATNRTATGMWIMLLSNLLNVLGNWLFIYGELGFPEMGLFGAGLSTWLSRVVMVMLFAVVLRWRNLSPRYHLGFWRPQRALLSSVRPMHSAGGFVALQMGLETAMFSLSILLVGRLGELPLAAHHIAITVQTLGFMIYYGGGAATCVRVSQFWGRGDVVEARRAVRGGIYLVMSLAVGMILTLLLFREPLARIFTPDEAAVALAVTLLLFGIIYQPADALQVATSNSLRATGEGKSLALVAFFSYFLVGLPLAYIMAFPVGLGVVGVWSAFPVGLGMAALGYSLRLHRLLSRATKGA